MPKPRANETKEEFIARFMSDEEAKRDYPDEKQRLAVAYSMWERHNKKSIFIPITKHYSRPLSENAQSKLSQVGEERFFEAVVSGLKEDRDGEFMSEEAIEDMIMQFKSGKIPFFPNHGLDPSGNKTYRWQEIMGTWVDARREGDNIVAVCKLNNANPEADLFWNYLQAGVPVGFSIGAKAEKWEDIEENDEPEMLKEKITALEEKRKELGMSVEEFYACPRDPPSESALPIFDEAHTRNAMARFNQTHFRSPEERKKAREKIIARAKKFGIDTSGFEEATK